MTELTSDLKVSGSEMTNSLKTGYWAAIANFIFGLFFLAAVAASFIALKGPPVGIYLTLTSVITLIGVVAMVFLWSAMHICTQPDRKVFSLCSLAMITVLTALTSITRIVQISLVPQALDAGKTDGLSWFLVYGELSVMADIEVLAWGGFLGLAMLFLAPVFRKQKLERTLFWTLIISGSLCLIGVVGKVLNIPALTFVGLSGWGLGLTIFMGLLVFWFKRKLIHR
ncbi:hypothetical protein ACFLXC_06235 [Chloroflexota bacterium]